MNPARRLISELRNVASMGGISLAASYARCVVFRLPSILKSRSLAPADSLIAGREGRFTASALGVSVSLPNGAFALARELYGRKVYFPDPRFHLNRGDMVVDLGANCGLFTVLAARLGARVLAVEAQFGYVREIQSLLDTNNSRASIEWAIVGGEKGMVSDGDICRRFDHFEGRTPPSARMMDLLDAHKIEQVDFLKCDIEGSEFALFSNPGDWLPRVRRIAMEVHPPFGNPDVLRDMLTDHGFAVTMKNAELQNAAMNGRGGFLYAIRR